MITVEGQKYVVIENLGFIHSRGMYGKVVEADGVERIVLKRGRSWIFAHPIIRRVSPETGQAI